MRNWDSTLNNDILGNPTLNDYICPQEQDYNDAISVAESLGLKLIRVDFIKEYWDYVFESFLSEYRLGRTPNPDILCNKYIKFDSFFNYAMDKGYDAIAMGHYAQKIVVDNKHYLAKGLDSNKDQSYFLCQMPKKALEKTLFPLGGLTKGEVRQLADELNLSIANKKDSTGVCFIGERNFKQFLNNYLPSKDGNIIDINSGDIVGRHNGVLYYTIGQRKGLGIGGGSGPFVVVSKNVYTNELYVVNINDDYWIYSNSCIVKDINLFNDIDKNVSHEISCKFRYRQSDQNVILTFLDDKTVRLDYKQKIPSVTVGQFAVFYNDNICLGGGVIDSIYIDEINHYDLVMNKIAGRNND